MNTNNDFGSLIKKEFPKSSENIFKGFIGQSSEGIALINEEGLIVECNEAMLHIYEVEKENIIGKHIWDFEPQFFIHEKQKKEFINKVYKIQKEYLKNIKDQKPETLETEIVTKTKVKYINLLIFPILTENACFVGRIINDITEKKEKEIELRNYKNRLELLVEERTGELKLSEEKFRLLFEKSHDPILIIDGYNFVECNESAVHMLGFKSKEDIFKIHPSQISPQHQPDGRLSYEKAQELMDLTYKEGFKRFEWIHINTKGHEIVMDISLTKIPYKGRQMIFTVWRDITKQKQYEKSLKASEKQFSTLFEQAADGILVGIKDGEIVEANESICNLTGYSKDELIGKNIKILFTKDILTKKPLRYDLVKKGETVISDRELVRKDGSIIHTEMNTKILDDGRMQALFRDVTKRKHIERALIESEEKYRNIFYSSPLGIFHYDVNGIITDCNENFVKIIGSNKTALVGLNMITQLKDKKLVKCVKDSLSKGEAYYEDLYQSVTANKRNYVRVLFNGIRDKQNQIISGLGIVEDITERKHAEELLKRSEEKISNIYHSSKDIIMIINSDAKIININQAIEKQLGYSVDSVINKSPKVIIGEKDWKSIEERIQQLLNGKKIAPREFKMISKDGKEILFEGNSKLINYEGERAILSIIRNITERKQLEQRIFDVMIETEEKERQRLASDIHDEVGPLLSSLKMYIEMINEKSGKEEFIKGKLQDLIKETIVNIREVSNDLSPNLLTNYGLISAIKSFIKTQKEIIKIDLNTNINNERFGIKIETVFYRILKELINNTIKHANASKVTIKMEYTDQKLILDYRDNGIGMNPKILTSCKTKGLGLNNIDNRVKTIDGKYEIITDKNKGFQFILTKEIQKK
ncbi:MAG: PAS domain S-box protein [Bacteroidetes bacterium]|nr:PAS domain S-box protein [Bacteroidota bacterium]